MLGNALFCRIPMSGRISISVTLSERLPVHFTFRWTAKNVPRASSSLEASGGTNLATPFGLIPKTGQSTHSENMPQFDLFSITPSIASYGLALTPAIDEALAAHRPVVVGISGGKDSSAVAIRTFEHLDQIGHCGPRLLVHCDLGEIEWAESLPVCRRLADLLRIELLVLQRRAGGLTTRWRQRWESNKARYRDLSCVRLIMPWSAAATRFCTSELKTAIVCQALVTHFPGQTILSVSGIRRAESASRSRAPVACEQPRLRRKKQGTCGWDWHPILDWSQEAVYAFLRTRNQPLHEAYTRYGSSRVSCAFCVLASVSDLRAAASCVTNQAVYQHLVELEVESSFSFQPKRWLGDVAPQLLPEELRARLEHAKQVAGERQILEQQIPRHLLYEGGWPTRLPSESEARLLASIRYEVSGLLGFEIRYRTAEEILARYEELLCAKSLRSH